MNDVIVASTLLWKSVVPHNNKNGMNNIRKIYF